MHSVQDSVLQSILSLACINLKENNIIFSRYFPWICLEFVSTTNMVRLITDHAGVEEEDKPRDMVRQDMEDGLNFVF